MSDKIHIGNNPEENPQKSGWLSRLVIQANLVFDTISYWQERAVAIFAPAAYGGLATTAPVVGGPTTIGAAWTDLTFSFVQSPSTSRGITIDAGSGSISFNVPGVYALAITVSFEHNNAQSGRTTYLRLYNTVTQTGGNGIVVATGRNTEATGFSATVLVEADRANEPFILQLGNGDSYTAVVWDAVSVQAWNVGEYRGDIQGAGGTGQFSSSEINLLSEFTASKYTTWDDLRFPATAVNPPGQASDPDWDNVIPGWLFSGSGTEVIHLIAQLPHSWVEGSDLKPHCHWMKSTSASGGVQWQLEYAWSAVGEVLSGWTTVSTSSVVSGTPDDDTANRQLISSFGVISGAGRQISDTLVFKLSRIGGSDTYNADARLLEFDIHYQKTILSSGEEYVK